MRNDDISLGKIVVWDKVEEWSDVFGFSFELLPTFFP